MYPPSMARPAVSRNETVDTSKRFSELYLGYASNLSHRTMKGRCPDSAFAGLARLSGWRWHINSTGYANIVPSPSSVVYGALFFLSPRDEAGLDESEGVPWMYEKKWLEVVRIGPDGNAVGDPVTTMTYVDVQRPDEGVIMTDYVVWINQAIRDATPFGLPKEYVEKSIRPYIPPSKNPEDDEKDMDAVRVMMMRSQPPQVAAQRRG